MQRGKKEAEDFSTKGKNRQMIKGTDLTKTVVVINCKQ